MKEKRIIMHQYNGTDYDTIYPKTIIPQVDGLQDELDDKSNKIIISTTQPTSQSINDLWYEDTTPSHLPLTFTANTAGSTVKLTNQGYGSWSGYYSTDNTNWSSYTAGGSAPTITLTNAGDKVYFKGPNGSTGTNAYIYFIMTGSISASGNIMSLCSGDNFTSTTTIPSDYCFYYLFKNCSSLKTAPLLPATTLTKYCYGVMFYNCANLVQAPKELPALTLAQACYAEMFESCTSLATVPKISATTLGNSSCQWMFKGCTSLTTVPILRATTLGQYTYSEMFSGCTSLYVSDTNVSGVSDKPWIIPSSGTFTNTYPQASMFTGCAGNRAARGSASTGDTMPGESGQSYTYYTQNEPI